MSNPVYPFIDKHAAAQIVCKHWRTLEKWRNDPGKGLLEKIHWVRDPSGEYLYNEILLRDWLIHHDDPEAHSAAIDQYLASLAVNQPKRKLFKQVRQSRA